MYIYIYIYIYIYGGTNHKQLVLLWQSKLALTLDAAVTVSHLMLPVRWSVMVWADILYAVI